MEENIISNTAKNVVKIRVGSMGGGCTSPSHKYASAHITITLECRVIFFLTKMAKYKIKI